MIDLNDSISDDHNHLYDMRQLNNVDPVIEVEFIDLRSSINYKIRSDLFLPELQAVFLEIIKPQSKPLHILLCIQ